MIMMIEIWKIYGITEDEHIEYSRCLEKLEATGLRDDNINKKVLQCNTCILCGGCTVSRENMFLGAKSC
jgi:hypothetical protein